MGDERAFVLVNQVAAGWVADPDSDVVYTEVLDGRIAVRVAQQTRDFTTIWFDVGDRTLTTEAYRQCLYRNFSSRQVHFAIDRHGDIYLRGSMSLDQVSEDSLASVLAEVYELVEVSFRPLIRAAFTTQ